MFAMGRSVLVGANAGPVELWGVPTRSQGIQWFPLLRYLLQISLPVFLSLFRCPDVYPLQRPDPPEVGRCSGVGVNPQQKVTIVPLCCCWCDFSLSCC